MSVQDVLRKVGQWNLNLVADAPPGIVGALEYFGHVAIVPGRVSPVERGDELLTLARYVGVLRSVQTSGQPTLAGVGMASWLGDEDGKGDVIEYPGVALTAVTFAAAIRALLPAHGAVTEGTLYSGISGTYTNTHAYQTPRTAIDYVCDTMAQGATWRVNGNGTLDAGPASSLFRTTPTCVIVRKNAGYDQTLKALPGQLDTLRDAKEYSTRVVIIAAALAGGTADASTVPYKDIHGNQLRVTRVVDEQDSTLVANASARATSALAAVNGVRRSVRLSADDFDIAGDFSPGDTVWVYDPDGGLVDTTNEVEFRGTIINPVAVSVQSLTWPIERGYTVGYRASSTGTWTDLTPWVDWEASGGGQIEVADSLATTLTPGVSSIGTQVAGGGGGAGDTAIPDVPTFGTFTTTSYQPGNGIALAAIKLTWTRPLNTDASTIVDGDHYEIRYRANGTTDWQTTYVAFDQLTLTVTGLATSTTYDFQIRAVDYASPINYGAWSSTTSFLSATDTTAPATPAPATVAANIVSIQVTHNLGLAAGGTFNLPLDLDHLEIHAGTVTGFTPSSATLLGNLPANAAMILGSIPAVGTFPTSSTAAVFVKVVAVDRTGNRSTASSSASATANLIDDAHISSLTASKITAGTITAAVVIGGSATFSGALSAATGTFAGSLAAATGTFAGALSAASGTFNGDISGASGTFTGDLSGSTITGATIVGNTLKTAASGARVEIGVTTGTEAIDLYSAGGDHAYIRAQNALGSNEVLIASASGSYVSVNGSTVSGANGNGYFSATNVGFIGASSGNTAYFSTNGSTATVWGSSSVDISSNGAVAIHPGGALNLWPFGNLNVGSSNNSNTYVSASSLINLSAPTVTIGSGSGSDTIQSGSIYNNTSTFTANVGIATSPFARFYRLTSSARYKVQIEPAALDPREVLKLAPVTYYDRAQWEANGQITDGLSQYLGLIAEPTRDIAGLGPLLTELDDEGAVSSVNYDRVAVALLVVQKDFARRLAALEARAA